MVLIERLSKLEGLRLGQLEDMLHHLNQCEEEIRRCTARLAELEGSSERYDELSKQLESLHQQEKQLDRDCEEQKRQLLGLQGRQGDLKASLGRLEAELQEAEPQLKKSHIARQVVELVDDLLKDAAPRYVDKLARSMTQTYKSMAHKQRLDHIEITPECDVHMIAPGGRELRNSVDSSAGEDQIFALALISAIMEVSPMTVMKANFSTSYEADRDNNYLMGQLGMSSRYAPARLAIARSLSLNTTPDPIPATTQGEGKTIHGQNLFGDDLKLWMALVIEHAGHELVSIQEFKDLIRRHWHRGISALMQDWERSHKNYDTFILRMAEQSGLKSGQEKGNTASFDPAGTHTPAGMVKLLLGNALGPLAPKGERETLHWVINAPGTSPHIAIMGATGAGKTRAGNLLLMQIREQARCPVILFDMGKGDLAANASLVQSLGAKVLSSPREPIPLDILRLERKDDTELQNVAVRFRESFERVSTSRLGGQQQDALREAILLALRTHTPTRLEHVRDALAQVYAQRARKADSVNATFNELTGWDLFKPELSPDEFFSRSWILDLHEATETAQRLIVFLVLDSLYRWQRLLPDSTIDPNTQHRSLRLVVGIDEARKVLGYRHDALAGLVRESRSKGLSVLLMSQSPDDYRKETDNFLENMGLLLCFKTNASSNSLNAAFGQQTDLGGLPLGVCVTRLQGRPGLTRIQVWES